MLLSDDREQSKGTERLNVHDQLPCGRMAIDVICAVFRAFGLLAPGRLPPQVDVDAMIPYLEEVLKDGRVASSYSETVSTLAANAATELYGRYPAPRPATAGDSAELRWAGDDLNQSPTAFALLQAIPPDFQENDNLLDFFNGKQWEDSVRGHREQSRRPTLTINMLPRIYAAALDASNRMFSDERMITDDELRRLKCWIADRNMNSQRLYNYIASAQLERAAAQNPDSRIFSPDKAGEAAYRAYMGGFLAKPSWEHLPDEDRKLFQKVAMAAIDYLLKQPKV